MKALPIGKSDFKKLIEEECYYVDKTQAIEDLFKSKAEVVLFPRPRRFGKSLFMSMLDNFFDIDKKEQNKDLFNGLNISKSPYYSELSNYPVIYLNLKELKQSTYESAYNQFKILISKLYESKKYVYDNLSSLNKEKYDLISNEKASIEDYKNSIRYLSEWLESFYNKKVIILIDEYDAAINESFSLGYYRELMDLLQPLLSSTLKDNTSLRMGVLTGVLRVGGESLFSSFNNLDVYDIMSENYNEYFGFTEKETKTLLNSYGLELTSEVKNYYDGYNFSGLHIYNPWSILNYANRKVLQPYWMNTGSNKLIKDLLNKNTNYNTIEKLLNGESVVSRYDNSITYQTFTSFTNINDLLNLLLITGYLTLDYKEVIDGENIYYFKIPNIEVSKDFNNIVQSIIFKEDNDYLTKLFEFKDSLFNGDKEKLESIMNESLENMSYHDKKEDFYHGFVFGFYSQFLNNKKYFEVDSNLESGKGRPDVIIERTDKTKGVVIEVKIVDNENEMEEKAKEAINQMKEKEYYKRLVSHNIQDIKTYAIVFCNKKVIVR